MRKIIGFKLVIRPHEVKRRAKKAKVTLPSDDELQKLLDDCSRKLSPGVLFDTFKHPDPDQPILSPMPGLAYSVVLATLGERFEAPEPMEPVIRETALDEAVRFATSLLEDEAAKDACELSPITAIGGGPGLEAVIRKLEGSKIGVELDGDALKPGATLAVSLSWLSKSKAKKPK